MSTERTGYLGDLFRNRSPRIVQFYPSQYPAKEISKAFIAILKRFEQGKDVSIALYAPDLENPNEIIEATYDYAWYDDFCKLTPMERYDDIKNIILTMTNAERIVVQLGHKPRKKSNTSTQVEPFYPNCPPLGEIDPSNDGFGPINAFLKGLDTTGI